ncbi:MAG: hypothetical protein R3320_10730, partial [Nitriliruptorales bacterium]|nr:hypothetical protein [Nitriliruptorales bacterium]
MRCLECGSRVAPGYRFCGHCGALLPSPAREDEVASGGSDTVGGSRRLPPDAASSVQDPSRPEASESEPLAGERPLSLRERALRLVAAAAVVGLVAVGVTWFAGGRPYDAATAGRSTATNNGTYEAPEGRDLATIRWRRDRR